MPSISAASLRRHRVFSSASAITSARLVLQPAHQRLQTLLLRNVRYLARSDPLPGAMVRTRWSTDDIWLRRTISLPGAKHSKLRFYVDHDEDVEVYVERGSGVLGGRLSHRYVLLDINTPALALLQPGATVTLAVHCHQTTGGQNIDVGLVNVVGGD